MAKKALSNAAFIGQELDWLKRCIEHRLLAFQFKEENNEKEKRKEAPLAIQAPKIIAGKSSCKYAKMLKEEGITDQQRLLLALAIAPELRPELLDDFFAQNKGLNKRFTEFGGAPAQTHRGFLPTWETFYFLGAGNDLEQRLSLQASFFQNNNPLFKSGLIQKGRIAAEEPEATMRILPSRKLLEQYVIERGEEGLFYEDRFPARPYSVPLELGDLILSPETSLSFDYLVKWIQVEEPSGVHNRFIEPGLKVLFYGPPGTGKSLAAGILGKETDRPVYRVDISKITSKYIGETEKNLARVFDLGQQSNWILFFDEADALFGTRVKAEDHKDRYGNHEVAYLLQRIEEYQGIIVLAANMVSGIDKAFSRRFQQVIPFHKPRYPERTRIWETYFVDAPIDKKTVKKSLWPQLAEAHQLTASNVKNVLRASLVKMRQEDKKSLNRQHIEWAIQEEIRKEKLI